MDRRAPSEGCYCFGPFRLDPAERLLTRDGTQISLTYRVFELLLVLVRSPSRLLTKDELMDAVWPGRIVEEGSLTQAVSTLRKALGGADEEGRHILTVPGRGYTFNVPVEIVTGAEPTARVRAALSQRPSVETAQVAPAAKQHWAMLGSVAAFGVIAIAAAGVAVVMWHRDGTRAATKPIVVVVADFQNLSPDPMFDKIFATATKMDLQQSPYLTVLPEKDVEDTLDLMTRSRASRLSAALAQEVCARNNGQVTVSGAVAQVGTKYLLTLTASDCVDDRAVSNEKAEVNSREALLPALDDLAGRVRERLGEPTDSIEKFNVPIAQATTSSFEALKAFSRGENARANGDNTNAATFFKRAIQLDPKFAMAHEELAASYFSLREPELARIDLQKAFEIRDRTSENETLQIASNYY